MVPNNPPPQVPLFRTELDTDFYYAATIGCVGNEVTFVANLGKGFFGGSVEFELEDVDCNRRLYHCIGTAAGTAYFGIDKLA